MSITINGSGTITGISTGGIPDGVVDTDVLADNAVTFGKIGTTEQGQLCKAWVNFDGTGTPSIRAAYNVSSITDVNPGRFTVNLTTSLTDTNYAVCVTGSANSDTQNQYQSNAYSRTTSGFGVVTTSGNNASWTDIADVNISVFR